MKKILYTYLLFLIIISSCKDNSTTYYKPNEVKKYAKGNLNIPLEFGYLIVFVKIQDNKIYSTNISILRNKYLKFYSNQYKTFESFLFDALNQRIIFVSRQFDNHESEVLLMDEGIKQDYDKLSFSNFRQRYCDKISDGKFVIRKEISNTLRRTILYYFSINDYQIVFNDNIGNYSIYKN